MHLWECWQEIRLKILGLGKARVPEEMLQSCSEDVEVQENGVCHLTRLWGTEMADQTNDSVGCFEWFSHLLGEAEVQEQGSLFDGELQRQMGEEGRLRLEVSRKALDSYSGQQNPFGKSHSGQPLWPFSPVLDPRGAVQAGFG